MSDILEDIVKDVEIKPDKSKLVLKWVIRIGSFLIGIAFVFGQYKMTNLDKMGDIQKSLKETKENIIELKTSQKEDFDALNAKVDKVYTDGYQAFDDFQQYNKKQLEIIVDYGQNNKELVKKMLDVNMMEKNKSVENQLQQAKATPIGKTSIGVRETTDYVSMMTSTAQNTHDTTFYVQGATKAYVDKVKSKYKVKNVQNSQKYSGLFDITFENK